MKVTKLAIGIILIFSMMLSGCSKEEDTMTMQEEKSYLSFNILLNDPAGRTPDKQMNSDYPGCPPGSPVFVEIILTMGNVYVAGTERSPLRLNLKAGSGGTNADGIPDYITETPAALELLAGTYTLEYFTVLDAWENVLWVAPVEDKSSGVLTGLVSGSLPLDINIGKREKKYQDVEVICFDERNLNEYGYTFYQFNGIQIIEFCLFGNYCDANGRHGEYMLFEADVWKYSGDPLAPKGELLHEDLQNEVIVTDYEDYAETQTFPLCFTLPDGPEPDEYYIEITQVNLWAENVLIRSGVISDADVRDLFRDNGTMEYFHFTEGECGIDDDPVLLNDLRDIIGDWEFTFVFGGDALLAADVVFYPDGSATYRLYGDPDASVWGTWAYFNNTLFYDPDGNEDLLGYDNLTGQLSKRSLSGSFWYGGYQEEWSAVRKE